MAEKKKTLTIAMRLEDFMTKRLGVVGKGIVRFTKFAVRSFKRFGSAITNLKNLFLGFVAIMVVRRAFGLLTGLAESLDFIVKMSDKLQVTTKSLQELTFVAERAGVQFDSFARGLGVMSKNIEAAREGSKIQLDAFQDLGIAINNLPLGPSGKIDMIALLKEFAEGFRAIEDPAAKVAALQNTLGRQGLQLGPLLAGGTKEIDKLVERMHRLVGVLSPKELQLAAAYQDALTDLKAAFRGTFQRIFVEVAPKIALFFTRFAEMIADNRTAVIEWAVSVGNALVNVVDLMLRSIIGLISAIESIPGVSLTTGIDREIRNLKKLEELSRIVAERLAKDPKAKLRGLGPRPRGMAQLGGSAIFDPLKDPEAVAARGPALRKRIAQLELVARRGVGGALTAMKNAMAEEFRKQVAEIGSAAAPLGPPKRRPGRSGREERLGTKALAGQLEDEAGVVRLKKQMLALQEPTRAIREEVAELDSELQRLSFEKAFDKGKLSSEDFAESLRLIDRNAERAVATIEQGILAQQLQEETAVARLKQQMLTLQEPTRAVRLEFAELETELERLDFEGLFDAGKISSEDFSESLRLIDRNAERVAATIEGGIGGALEGMRSRTADVLDEWSDLTKVGESVGDLVGTAFGGVEDALVDVVTGAKSAKEAFKDFALSILADLARIAIKFVIVGTIKKVFGFGEGGTGKGVTAAVPVKSFQHGGVVTEPTIAIFGEGGAKGEAFVPLPDGRNIPVVLQGSTGRQVNLNFNITAFDSGDVSRFLIDNRETVLALYEDALQREDSTRNAVKALRG